MRMIACCLLLAALVSCEQPRAPPPQPQRPTRFVPAPKPDDMHERHERAISDMQDEIRRLRGAIEKNKEQK